MSRDDLELGLLKEADPTEAAAHLVASAIERNTLDNVAVALIFRPERETEEVPAGFTGTSQPELTPWKPEKLLGGSKRVPYRRRMSRKRVVFLAAVVTLVVTLAMAFIWDRVL